MNKLFRWWWKHEQQRQLERGIKSELVDEDEYQAHYYMWLAAGIFILALHLMLKWS